ncbi:MAG: DUF2225 domain-containing protein [candidate division Zixibacteria bacterium]|nr:DUF2225 domain-containing protein [candidate division Zixibacteria bacterium]
MANEIPFFLSKVECPICKTINEFETLKMGAYVEEDRDTDFCPLEIKWRSPKYQSYNPLAFFVATCSNCYYSHELTNKFKEWKSDNNFRTYKLKAIKDVHLDQLAVSDSFVKRIGEAIDLDLFPNESAILKLHLAVFDEQAFAHHSKLDVGRYYLRIGWVFRGLESFADPMQAAMQGMLSDLNSRYKTLWGAVDQSRDEIGKFVEYSDALFNTDDITASLKSQLLPFNERFQAAGKGIADSLESTSQQLNSLNDLITEFRSVSIGGETADSSGAKFGKSASFNQFLTELKENWDGIVTNEHEALEKAVKNYSEAYIEGRGIAQGNQQIQVLYLIAELSRRVGDYETAKEFFNSTIKNGQEYIYRNRNDKSRTALARKILELAIEQGKENMRVLKSS